MVYLTALDLGGSFWPSVSRGEHDSNFFTGSICPGCCAGSACTGGPGAQEVPGRADSTHRLWQFRPSGSRVDPSRRNPTAEQGPNACRPGLPDSGRRKLQASRRRRSANTISHQGLEQYGKTHQVNITGRGPGIGCHPVSCTAGNSADSCRIPVTARAKSLARHCPPGASCWLLDP